MISRAKICISDNHTIFRNALTELITLKGEYEVVFDASDSNELFHKLTVENADIVLMDIYFPETDGLKIIEELQKSYPQIKIIVISLCCDLDVIDKAFNLGIHGYISKTASLTELWEALNQVQNGRLFENKMLKESLYYQATKRVAKGKTDNLFKNNPIHLKILELLWQEKSTREIARQLLMSISSIEKIKQQLKEETGAKSNIGLIKYALRKKLIIPVLHADSSLI
jgi:DNA-binding NarL/FixJ family response regulator